VLILELSELPEASAYLIRPSADGWPALRLPVAVISSSSLLFAAIIAVVRQKFHLSSCADFRNRLSQDDRPVDVLPAL
jgi:hypothetical protein